MLHRLRPIVAVAATVLLSAVPVASVLCQALPPPEVSKPRDKPKPKPSDGKSGDGGARQAAPPAAPLPTLLLSSDLACTVTVDGDKATSVPAKGLKKITVSPGQHLLSATTADGKLTWEGVVDAKGGQQVVQIKLASAAPTVSLDDFDKAAADVWIAYRDLGVAGEFAKAALTKSFGFHDQNISTVLHTANQQLMVEMEELKRLQPKSDPARMRVLDEATKVAVNATKYIDLMTKAVTSAQRSNSFIGEPQDLYSQANAILATTRLSQESWATLAQSAAFKAALPKDRLRELRVADDGQDFNLGLDYLNASPLMVAAVTKGSLAEDLGFKPSDRLVSVSGRPIASIWDLKLAMRQGAGRPLEVVWERQGKTQKKTVKVPAQLPR